MSLDEYVGYDKMRELSKETKTDMNQLFVGYLRQPIQYFGENGELFVRGTCAIDGIRCEYSPPQSCQNCPIYTRFMGK